MKREQRAARPGGTRVFLIDGTAFCYRAFHGIRNLSTADGRPTNAVYGFATMLQALRDKERPEALAVAFDVGKPTFRHKKFDEYKSHRKPMPDLLIAQLPVVKRLLAAYRIPVFECEGYEGEDVLATIAKHLAGDDADVFLVTGDKDALQLVGPHVKVYDPHRDDDAVLDTEAVKARFGVGPEGVVDLMALIGDDTDNIPGVPGIGPKTAAQLLQQFGSLDQLYQHLDQVDQPARRDALKAAREQVALSRELAQITSDVPLEVTLKDLTIQEPDWRALRALFRELEFRRLLQAVDAAGPAPEASGVPADVTDAEEFARRLEALHQPAVLGCWPIGSDTAAPQAVLLAAAGGAGPAGMIRFDQAVAATPGGQRIAQWLSDAAAPKIGHDLKGAARLLRQFGITLQGMAGDTLVAAYLLNPARTSQSLADLADEYLEERLQPIAAADGLEGADDPALRGPVGQHLGAVRQLHDRFTARLDEQELGSLYRALEVPLTSVLAQMEAEGIAVDLAHLAGLRATMDAQLLQLTQEIYGLAGCSFNLNSPRQLAQVLFERLQLPVVKRTKTGASTDSAVLAQLADRHPLPKLLLQYRELSKLVSTYVEALPKLVDPSTGRLHTTLNQTATATGRLSSSEPNLQNIPIKTELGRSIRRAFIAGEPGGALIAADYSQIELRILAHVSGDAKLLEAFRQGRDIHRFTASLIYGIPEAEVQPEQRSAMKAVNFGILYGMSAHGLSKELGMPYEEAQTFITAYFERYPGVRAYLDSQIAHAKKEGYVRTLMGRRRYIPEVNNPDMMIRQFGERMAVNAPIQGTAADIIKQAMVALARALREQRLRTRMVLQVHDELVFDAPRGEQEQAVALIRRLMEGALELAVPLTVTVKAGPNWLDLSPV